MKSLIQCDQKLGFGMMRLPGSGSGNIDIEQTKKMVDLFMEAGGRYFDTAYVYTGSEEAVKKALCERYPRESYYLASKVNAAPFACKNAEEAKKQIEISLERTGAGYFDFYLLHALDAEKAKVYEEYGLWDYVRGLKEKGLIRHYGFSFHDTAEVLEDILKKHPDAEFVQLQLNYADWEDKGIQSRACYEVAVKYDKPVVVMEPVKGGMLAAPPESVAQIFKEADPESSFSSWAIRFVASLPQVMVVLSGMSREAQMQDNLSYMKDFKPLTPEEEKTVEKAREALSRVERIPCTECRYCVPGCPVEMHIPDIFKVMNIYKVYGDLKRSQADYGCRFKGPKASACLACGQCENACPQHLPIVSLLQEIADTLEKKN